jgi:hypothetical protein
LDENYYTNEELDQFIWNKDKLNIVHYCDDHLCTKCNNLFLPKDFLKEKLSNNDETKNVLNLCAKCSIVHKWDVFLDGYEKSALSNDKQYLCTICMDNLIEILFVPCGHLCCCSSCAKQIQNKKCPICRNEWIMMLTVLEND